jgi:hypothetical protein
MRRLVFLALCAALVATSCGGDDDSSSEAATSAPTSVPPSSSIPAGDGSIEVSIEPGTYQVPKSAWSVADFTITFPKDWTVQYGHVYHKDANAGDEIGFYAVVPDAIYADPCVGSNTGELMDVGPSVDDFAEALLRQPGPMKSGPVDTTLGGYPAKRIDLTIPKGFDLSVCNVKDIGLQIWYSPPADKYFVLLQSEIASVYILDVNGQRQVFLTGHNSASSREDVRELQTILDSIRIES